MDLTDLRQAAIDLLQQSSADDTRLRQQSPEELIHELRVHQVELEMQNEELRRAQLELEESHDRFVNLFDFAPVGYVTLDADNRIIEANLTIAKMLGAERGALVGQNFSRHVTNADSTRLHRHLGDLKMAENKTSCELTLNKVDGSPLHVRLDSIAVGDGNRSVAIADLSENDILAREKQDSDERLRVICHALPIPIAYVDRAETYQFNNAAHERRFEISRASIAGLHVKEFFGGEIYKLLSPRIKQVLSGSACSCQLELPDGDRGPQLAEVHYAPLRDVKEGVVGFYELIFDLSVSRHFEEEQARRTELESQLSQLSSRQRAVFDRLMAGSSNKAIALELDFGMRTVERERHDILELLGVESINELLVKFAGLAAFDDLNQA